MKLKLAPGGSKLQLELDFLGETSCAKFLRQRLILEELLRKRCSNDAERYVETFRRSAVDPNPHQVEAVAFALSRLDSGGAMLCDEVGLGKTIETGLLLTQLRAEGRCNILIIVPVPLARQWQVELRDLFSLKSTVIGKDNIDKHTGRGICIVGREFAGSPVWSARLAERSWDLVVVDEAHEFLSSLHARFSSRDGVYQTDLKKGKSRRAGYLKHLIGERPVILLTATPLQNSLLELWSLVRFVDPSGIALGDLHEFNRLFCVSKGRELREGTEIELRSRLSGSVCRTLRADAQPFLRTPFTKRRCETINFSMEAAERELYQAVSDWLEGPIAAYRSRNRRMITLLLRRRMGSSVFALSSSLNKIRQRLEDTESDWEPDEDVSMDMIENDVQELHRLERLAERALTEPSPKLEALWELVERVARGAVRGVASDKLVVFTESRITLKSVVEFLEHRGLKGLVTAFSGQNDTDAAAQALATWETEVGVHLDSGQRPERSSALRAALVHEFKTRTRILVATEAGAKGLNLQFCNCLVNFDLPWNPQRIEQRIGRVHRYGQRHDVVIVNFINQDNEGEARVYELLNEKLQLFEGLFGASDPVLGQVASMFDFEKRIEDLFSLCRTKEERQLEFDRLELELDGQTRQLLDQQRTKAVQLIASLDDDVQKRLRLTSEELPMAISRRDEALIALLECDSPVHRLEPDGDRVVFEWESHRYHLGPPKPSQACGEPLNLDHPRLRLLIDDAKMLTEGRVFQQSGPEATWCVYRVTICGLESEERLLVLGPGGQAELLKALERHEAVLPTELEWVEHPDLEDSLETLRDEMELRQKPRLDQALRQLAARKDDVRRCLEDEEQQLNQSLREAERKQTYARSPEALTAASATVTRLQLQLQKLLSSKDERLWEAAQTLRKRTNELHEQSFASTESFPLFCLRRMERFN